MYFKNFVLRTMFAFFPYVFLYDAYLKISSFVRHLHFIYDEILAGFIYGEAVMFTEKEMLIEGNLVQLRVFGVILFFYLHEGLHYGSHREDEYEDYKNKKFGPEKGYYYIIDDDENTNQSSKVN